MMNAGGFIAVQYRLIIKTKWTFQSQTAHSTEYHEVYVWTERDKIFNASCFKILRIATEPWAAVIYVN